jgi:release factor glutamine methyltransferase
VKRVISGSNPVELTLGNALYNALKQLLNNIPLQYVLGKAYFMNMEFIVGSSVLIPRPETEELVNLIVKEHSILKPINNIKVLDIGTGSGCIAISLKHLILNSNVTAIDISEEALSVAKANSDKNNTEVDFFMADILDRNQWNFLPECDLIVSNPPYVTNHEKQFMNKNVLNYEPHTALFVSDDDPLIFYRLIMDFAKAKLSAGGSLWFEINEKFGEELKAMANRKGFSQSNIFSDIHGKSRFLHTIN